MANRSKQKTLRNFPDAIATTVGWVDPAKGELLVSIRGLPGAVEWDRKANTFGGKAAKPAVEKKAKVEKVEAPVKEEVKVETVMIEEKVEKPAKSKTARKPKAKKTAE